MIKQIYPYLKRAYAGKRVWRRLKRQFKPGEYTQFVIFPEMDEALNQTAIKYLPNLMERRSSDRVILVCTKDNKPKLDAKGLPFEVNYSLNSPADIESFLHYYELMIFSKTLSIVSLTKPNGQNLHLFMGVNGIGLDDMVCLAIYGLRKLPEE